MQHNINYLLHLADSNLVLSQRNAEWCGHGPVLEQDIAITNITLDLLGQARNFYQYAASLINQSTSQPNQPASEDSLAYLRSEREFKNLLLCELPRGDWAHTILRQFFYSSFTQLLYTELLNSGDEQVAAIAEKSLKEINYHVRWSSEWVIRLGDGTAESHQRMDHALKELWPYTGEMFIAADYEKENGIDYEKLKTIWANRVSSVLQEATLAPFPLERAGAEVFMHTGGKTGIHTEHMGFILSEMQYLQRAYPGVNW